MRAATSTGANDAEGTSSLVARYVEPHARATATRTPSVRRALLGTRRASLAQGIRTSGPLANYHIRLT
ncbi:MAG: hypothetical protein BGO37_04925 [Cellulomonas sp. 73-92]|nr:MAG: hypothetical protein BGO37_04925 [Cellulomonas sp. 73-92]